MCRAVSGCHIDDRKPRGIGTQSNMTGRLRGGRGAGSIVDAPEATYRDPIIWRRFRAGKLVSAAMLMEPLLVVFENLIAGVRGLSMMAGLVLMLEVVLVAPSDLSLRGREM